LNGNGTNWFLAKKMLSEEEIHKFTEINNKIRQEEIGFN